MKRLIFLFVAVFSLTFANAQNSFDALRYSQDNTNGTARFNAMSGAFGALGGDLSAIAINPAGSAVFLNNSASVSLNVSDLDNDATYFGNQIQSNDNELSLNQGGIVFVFPNTNQTSKWKKFSFGLNYNNTQNYDNQLSIVGTGNTSVAEFFTQQAQGIPLDLLELRAGETISELYNFLGENEGVAAQNAFLGYQSFIFDPVSNDPNNTEYISNVAPGNFAHRYSYLTQGYAGKYTLNFATQYDDTFFFGINLNSHAIQYDRSTFLFESNSNTGSRVNEIGFQNNLFVIGAGFSAQVGAIAKFDNLRLGFTYDTPTWFEISEETSQYVETSRTENNQNIIEIIDPQVLNVFASYNLQTPSKLTASGAYIFDKKGLISFDYSFKDFANIEFSPENDIFFASQNETISNTLKGVSTYRLGGEYRVNRWSLRGGLFFEESPFVDETTIGDTSGFSLGFGYNFGNYNFDLSYARSEQEREQSLYNIGLTDAANVLTTNSNVVFTFGINL